MKYVIVNMETTDPLDHVPVFWSNEFGWVDATDADTFSEDEYKQADPPLGGKWIPKQDALYFFDDTLGVHAPSKPCKCKGQCEGGE